jgi:hypothetical protein
MTAIHNAFRVAIEAGDLDALRACFNDDATFHSPAVFKPYAGIDAVMFLLTGVMQVFEDFRYLHALDAAPGGTVHALMFEARVGDKTVQGIDLLTYDMDGKITDLTVMIRPLTGLQTVVEKMGEALAQIQSHTAATAL